MRSRLPAILRCALAAMLAVSLLAPSSLAAPLPLPLADAAGTDGPGCACCSPEACACSADTAPRPEAPQAPPEARREGASLAAPALLPAQVPSLDDHVAVRALAASPRTLRTSPPLFLTHCSFLC